MASEIPGKAYALTVAAAAIALVWWTTTSYPLHPAIAMRWEGINGSAAILVGVGYWTLFGLIGALRARELESGAVLTFHMPFVVAGTILGGPVVGGWMGLLSQFERREFEAVPWYGMLGNHAIIALAAIAAGAAGDGVALLGASSMSPWCSPWRRCGVRSASSTFFAHTTASSARLSWLKGSWPG